LPEIHLGTHLAPIFLILHQIAGFNPILENSEESVTNSLRSIMQMINGEKLMDEVI